MCIAVSVKIDNELKKLIIPCFEKLIDFSAERNSVCLLLYCYIINLLTFCQIICTEFILVTILCFDVWSNTLSLIFHAAICH